MSKELQPTKYDKEFKSDKEAFQHCQQIMQTQSDKVSAATFSLLSKKSGTSIYRILLTYHPSPPVQTIKVIKPK